LKKQREGGSGKRSHLATSQKINNGGAYCQQTKVYISS